MAFPKLIVDVRRSQGLSFLYIRFIGNFIIIIIPLDELAKRRLDFSRVRPQREALSLG